MQNAINSSLYDRNAINLLPYMQKAIKLLSYVQNAIKPLPYGQNAICLNIIEIIREVTKGFTDILVTAVNLLPY